MKLRLVIPAEVQRDIAEAMRWYEEREAGLGRRFWRNLKRLFFIIKSRPEFATPFAGRYRKTKMKGFPYLVFYCIREHEIVISLVVHAVRDPEEIRRR